MPSFRFSEFAQTGGLVGYGINIVGLFRRAASFVARILKGAAPADLPVERPTNFDLVINLKTANALGVQDAAVAAGACMKMTSATSVTE